MGVSQATLELLIQLKDEASSALGGIAGSLTSLGGAALGIAAGGVAAFGAAIVSGLGDAREADQLLAQTQAVITSTGNAAGTSAQHIVDYASSLSDAAGVSLFGDDQVQASENMLLTFTNIKGDVLDLATAMTVDMAQAFKSTPEQMSVMIGKLLNSADAMGAAKRMGISFTDEQMKLGKAMFDAGDMAGYQKLVLAELSKEFGGSAQAAANADGGMAQFTGRLGEAKEALGHAVIPLLNMLVGVLNTSVMPIIESAAQTFGDLIKAFQTGASEGGGIIGGLSNAFYSLDGISPIFDDIGDAVVNVGGIINGIVSTVSGLVSSFQSAGESSSSLGTTISTTLIPILGGELATAIGTFVDWLSIRIPEAIASASDFVTNTLLPALSGLWAIIQTSILPVIASLIAQFLTVLPGAIDTVVALVSANLQPILVGLGAALLAIVVPAFIAWAAAAVSAAIATIAALAPVLIPIAAIGAAAALLYAAWNSNFLGIQTTVMGVWATLQPIFTTLVNWLSNVIADAVRGLAVLWSGTLQPALTTVGNIIQTVIMPILQALATVAIAIVKFEVQALAALWTNVLQPALSAVWNFIQGSLMPILQVLATVAIAVVKTEVQNLSNLWNNTLKPALDTVWGFISGSLIPTLQSLANNAIAGVKIATQTLADLWNNTLKPAIDTITGLISGGLTAALNTIQGVIGTVAGAFGSISRAVDSVIGTINSLISTLNSVHIPDWLQGHSPPPMANWFDDISDAVDRLSGGAMPALQKGMNNALGGIPSIVKTIGSAINALTDTTSDAGSAIGDLLRPASMIDAAIAAVTGPASAGRTALKDKSTAFTNTPINQPTGAVMPPAQDINININLSINGNPPPRSIEDAIKKGIDTAFKDLGIDSYIKKRLR